MHESGMWKCVRIWTARMDNRGISEAAVQDFVDQIRGLMKEDKEAGAGAGWILVNSRILFELVNSALYPRFRERIVAACCSFLLRKALSWSRSISNCSASTDCPRTSGSAGFGAPRGRARARGVPVRGRAPARARAAADAPAAARRARGRPRAARRALRARRRRRRVPLGGLTYLKKGA